MVTGGGGDSLFGPLSVGLTDSRSRDGRGGLVLTGGALLTDDFLLPLELLAAESASPADSEGKKEERRSPQVLDFWRGRWRGTGGGASPLTKCLLEDGGLESITDFRLFLSRGGEV